MPQNRFILYFISGSKKRDFASLLRRVCPRPQVNVESKEEVGLFVSHLKEETNLIHLADNDINPTQITICEERKKYFRFLWIHYGISTINSSLADFSSSKKKNVLQYLKKLKYNKKI